MKKILYLLLFFNAGLFAQSPALFEEANAAYADGKYEEAIEKYNQILENGETAVAVHYNLANAHYKLNHIAPSIYHYEKALQMAPEDEDVQNNIVFARNMALDAIEETPETEISGWMRTGFSAFSISGWGWAGIAFMVLFVAFFLSYYFSSRTLMKRIFFIAAMVCVVFAIGSVIMGYSSKNFQESQDFAIIFSEEVEVRNEPNSRGSEAFILHEGTKVEVLENFQEWSKIELANGNQGWMLQESFKRL